MVTMLKGQVADLAEGFNVTQLLQVQEVSIGYCCHPGRDRDRVYSIQLSPLEYTAPPLRPL